MKKFIFTFLFFIAAPVFGQVEVVEVEVLDLEAPEVEVLDEEIVDLIEATTTSTTTLEVIEIEATTTEVVLDEEELATSTQEIDEEATSTQQEVITETISIIPGSLSLKLSATPPVAPEVGLDGDVTLDDGLFNLIYTGFEEFVFKVFGM